MATKKKTPTPRPAPRPAPLTWGVAQAILKAQRGFTVECTVPDSYLVEQRVQMRRFKKKWQYRYQYERSGRVTFVWGPWLPLMLDADMADAKWIALPKGKR